MDHRSVSREVLITHSSEADCAQLEHKDEPTFEQLKSSGSPFRTTEELENRLMNSHMFHDFMYSLAEIDDGETGVRDKVPMVTVTSQRGIEKQVCSSDEGLVKTPLDGSGPAQLTCV